MTSTPSSVATSHGAKPLKFTGGHTNDKEMMDQVRFSFGLMDGDGTSDVPYRCSNVSIKLMGLYGGTFNCFAAPKLLGKYIQTNKWLEFIHDNSMEYYVFRPDLQ